MKKLDPKSIENILSLTPLQEGMLFRYLQEPQSGLYFEQLSLGISGSIDVQVFEKAWNFVIQANGMLRTVFRWEKLEKPSQIILKKHACQIRFYDFSDMDDGQKKTVLSQIKTGDRDKGFDLTYVPFRVTLCKLAERQYEMVISNHHILYDGWSNGIILKEFFNAYHALSKGEQTPPLSAKPSLKEYIKWLQSRDRNKQEQYWTNYLAGFETPTELPIKRKKEDTTGTGDYSLVLGEDIQSKLNIFIKNNRVTLASMFYTAWGILLQRYCNSEDIVFGTTVSGRSADMKGIEDMVGLFINTIPLRIKAYPGETVIDAVFWIDQVLWEREKFENTPLANIRSYSSVGGSGSLFDTIIVIENYPLDNHLVPEGSLLSIYSHAMIGTTYYDLSIGIMSFKEIEIKFIFKQELFDKGGIENLAGHFKGIIQNMIENPGTALSQLEIISCEEKNRMLYEFNNTGVEYLNDKTIHRSFEEQVERTPDHTALVGEAGKIHLSYGLLNEKSNRLAWYLRKKGVKPDNIVGIMIGPGIEMITAIFSVLKAGGVYLPVDPAYPGERIQFMLEDSGAKFLLITAGVME
ncbi:MAG TPA: condensation domain-containing protein, partial [Candidatus Kapabacteria bacterium]|nr:condensation domain-containing protein [Candidatus Kapabacteria bacterium]